MCIMFFWSCFAFYNVLYFSKNILLMQEVNKLDTGEQAIAYIRLLYEVYLNKQD